MSRTVYLYLKYLPIQTYNVRDVNDLYKAGFFQRLSLARPTQVPITVS